MKKRNSIKSILLLTIISFVGVACVDEIKFGNAFLEKAPGEDVNEDVIFSKKVYTDYLLWQCYEGLFTPFKNCYAGNGQFETLSDIMHSEEGWDSMGRFHYTGVLSASNANPGWLVARAAYITSGGMENMSNTAFRCIWTGIRDCCLLLDNVDRVPDMTDAEKARYKAEAKVIMASKYFDGIHNFGGLPIVDHALAADEVLEKPRSTIEETVTFVVRLLDEAIAEPELPWNIPTSELATWAGRVTKASALGIKAKLLNYVASPIFNSDTPYCVEEPQEAVNALQVWYGNYDVKRWEAVVDACEEFFRMNSANGNYYQLEEATTPDEAGYRAAFRKAYRARGNRESLLEVHDRVYMLEWDNQPGGFWHDGGIAPTLEWMEMFPWADGKNYDGQKYYNQRPAQKDIFEKRDPRLYESIVVQKRDYKHQIYGEDNPIQLWEGGEFLTSGGRYNCKPWGLPTYKFVLDLGDAIQGGKGTIDKEPFQTSYIRLAELYLIYAEALAETGNNVKALEQINKVIARVGLGKLEVMNPELSLTTNKENLIKEIMRERACELGFEYETRLHDMNRRVMEKDFKKHLHGIHIYRLDDDNDLVLEKWTKDSGDPFPTKFLYVPYDLNEGDATAVGYTIIKDGKESKIESPTGMTANPRFVWEHPERWSNKWLLVPLPPDEINKNYGLTQNPGWY